jgi:hypothetical protein
MKLFFFTLIFTPNLSQMNHSELAEDVIFEDFEACGTYVDVRNFYHQQQQSQQQQHQQQNEAIIPPNAPLVFEEDEELKVAGFHLDELFNNVSIKSKERIFEDIKKQLIETFHLDFLSHDVLNDLWIEANTCEVCKETFSCQC